MSERYFYEPAQGHGLAHNPFGSIIAPRPIGWISSVSLTGVHNLAPYSYFNSFNYSPPIIGFSSIGWKDSVANVEATREFGWSLATQDLAEPMNMSSTEVEADVDEFQLAGLATAPSRLIDPKLVRDSPASFECRLTQILRLTDLTDRELDTWVVFGEVVGVHIRADALRDGCFDTGAARAIMRGGGMADYFGVTPESKFEMERPVVKHP